MDTKTCCTPAVVYKGEYVELVAEPVAPSNWMVACGRETFAELSRVGGRQGWRAETPGGFQCGGTAKDEVITNYDQARRGLLADANPE